MDVIIKDEKVMESIGFALHMDFKSHTTEECQESVCTACRAELKKHNERYTQKKKGELARLDHMIRELALPVSAPQQTWASWHHETDSTARQELAIKLLQHHLAGAEASEDQAGEGKELRLAISMAIATLVTQLALRRINDAKDKTPLDDLDRLLRVQLNQDSRTRWKKLKKEVEHPDLTRGEHLAVGILHTGELLASATMDDFFENVMASANALEKAFNTITAAADRSVAEVAAAAAAAAAPSQPGTGANNADAEIGGHGCFIHDGDADDDGGGTTEEGSDAEGPLEDEQRDMLQESNELDRTQSSVEDLILEHVDFHSAATEAVQMTELLHDLGIAKPTSSDFKEAARTLKHNGLEPRRTGGRKVYDLSYYGNRGGHGAAAAAPAPAFPQPSKPRRPKQEKPMKPKREKKREKKRPRKPAASRSAKTRSTILPGLTTLMETDDAVVPCGASASAAKSKSGEPDPMASLKRGQGNGKRKRLGDPTADLIPAKVSGRQRPNAWRRSVIAKLGITDDVASLYNMLFSTARMTSKLLADIKSDTDNGAGGGSVVVNETPTVMQIYPTGSLADTFKTQIQQKWLEDGKSPIKLFLKDDVAAQDRWLQDLNWPQILKNFQSSEKHGISLEPPMLELRAIPRTDDREWCRGQQGVFVKHGAYVPRGTVLGPYCCEVYFDAEWNRLKVNSPTEMEMSYEFIMSDEWRLTDKNSVLLGSLLGISQRHGSVLRYVKDYRVDPWADPDDADAIRDAVPVLTTAAPLKSGSRAQKSQASRAPSGRAAAAVAMAAVASSLDTATTVAAAADPGLGRGCGPNCALVEVCDKGWPFAFVVATQDILAGKEVVQFRGPDYFSEYERCESDTNRRIEVTKQLTECYQDLHAGIDIIEKDLLPSSK